jgi:disulfide bond formation protein DsbB
MAASRNATRLLAGMALISLGALAAALVSQYGFDMDPCPWCVLERAIFVAIALACGIGLVLHRLVGAGLAFMLALCGIASALWQHFEAAKSQSCNLTLADKIVSRTLHLDSLLPSVFEPRASCADAAVNLLGVPYDFWALAAFVILALAALRILLRSS